MLPKMMEQATEFTMSTSPRSRTRNAGTKRNYKCLNDGPISAEVLKDAEKEARVKRTRAALPRDPNEPPRKRGRPRKERPPAADESPPTTPSDKSTNTDASMRQFFTEGTPDSASDEEREWANNLETFRTSPSPSPTSSPRKSSVAAMDIQRCSISYNDLLNTTDKLVTFHSPAEDVAVLFLAVVEQASLEKAEKARAEAAVKAGLAKTLSATLNTGVRAKREAAEKARAECARLEAAAKARLEAAERARQEAAEKARLEEAERAWWAAAQAAQIAHNRSKARRTTKSKQRKGKVQKPCSRRKSVPRQAI